MIVPTPDVEIIDNWHVSGLKRTGSGDFEVRDLFVRISERCPETRSKPLKRSPTTEGYAYFFDYRRPA